MSTPRALILLAHGSRDPLWRAPFEQIATQIRSQNAQLCVRTAYMELCQPRAEEVVPELLALDVQHITIAPLFLGMGAHTREDLPELLQTLQTAHRQVRFEVLPTLGENSALLALISTQLLDALKA